MPLLLISLNEYNPPVNETGTISLENDSFQRFTSAVHVRAHRRITCCLIEFSYVSANPLSVAI